MILRCRWPKRCRKNLVFLTFTLINLLFPKKSMKPIKIFFGYLELELPGELEGLYQNAREKIEKKQG